MKELVFNIKDIFNSETPSGCLTQYDSTYYQIPPYQRGYKWASDNNGAVTILINDLWSAFQKSKELDRKEYYLQYITVKPIQRDKEKYLEVIDGQQRLTTLSIMLSVISHILKEENIAKDKLNYAIRDNFFTENIYNQNGLQKLLQKSWKELISDNDVLNTQDIFYLHSATKKISQTFDSPKYRNELEIFQQYLLSNIKLIVNSVESHVESETVFRNLNSNKVPLTEAELIKGLLITKVGRQPQRNHTKNFQEIIEIRANLGRRWDELASWANRPEISSFYFNNHADSMGQLLKLTALTLEVEGNPLQKNTHTGDFPIFNFFLSQEGFQEVIDRLIEIKNKLHSWFDNTVIYNQLGYARYHKGSSLNNLEFLVELLKYKNKDEILKTLTEKRKGLIGKLDVADLSYTDSTEELHQVLLALNVFIEGQKDIRFNFYNYEKQKWSLEHIFPQTSEGKKKILSEENKKAILDILGDAASLEVRDLLSKESRTEEEKEIYYKALREHPALNSLGNMCLLTSSDNSSNGNMFFNEKRENILNRVRKGSFVPRHTFDVFSKMINGADLQNMKSWNKNDIEANKNHIEEALKKVVSE